MRMNGVRSPRRDSRSSTPSRSSRSRNPPRVPGQQRRAAPVLGRERRPGRRRSGPAARVPGGPARAARSPVMPRRRRQGQLAPLSAPPSAPPSCTPGVPVAGTGVGRALGRAAVGAAVRSTVVDARGAAAGAGVGGALRSAVRSAVVLARGAAARAGVGRAPRPRIRRSSSCPRRRVPLVLLGVVVTGAGDRAGLPGRSLIQSHPSRRILGEPALGRSLGTLYVSGPRADGYPVPARRPYDEGDHQSAADQRAHLGRDDRGDRRAARAGPCAGGTATAPGGLPGGHGVVRVLHPGRARVRCLDVVGARQRVRHRVPRRLHRREEPLGRQPVRLRDHHDDVRGARGAPAQGPDVRDRARADHARDLHRARCHAAVAVLVHVPDLRAAADLHGGAAVPAPGRRPGHRGQRRGQDGAAAPARSPTSTSAASSSPGSTGAGWSPR